jgi:tRNA-dihydrouridine synthase B
VSNQVSNQDFWQSKIKIGKEEYSRFMSAPLDGITDSPLRKLIREFSPEELLFTEMRHVAMVANERTGICLKYDPIEQSMAFQVSTNKTDFIDKAIEKILAAGFKSINLNSGCPAKAVVKSKCGSALMEDVPHLEMLLKYFIKRIDNRASFTVKIRAGFKKKNALEVAKMAQDCGVDAVIIHPRTQPEGFASRLDYELARQVKQALTVPLIFSGNISRFEMAQKVYELTGCDGYMIGRALWGAPWKMHEMTEAAQGKTFEVTTDLALRCALKHLDNNIQFYGPKGFIPFKKQLPQYVRFVVDASEWRQKLLRSQTETEMRELLIQLIKENREKQI